MKLQRTSRDFESLRASITAIVSGRKDTDVPAQMMAWINHLIELKKLLALDSGLAQYLSWEELQGISIAHECADKASEAGTCPRCKGKSNNPYTCSKCGLRLVA